MKLHNIQKGRQRTYLYLYNIFSIIITRTSNLSKTDNLIVYAFM